MGIFVAVVYETISFTTCSVLDTGKSTAPLAGLHIRNNVLNVTRTNVDLGITVTDDLKQSPGSWFLVHPASKTHWATRFLQLQAPVLCSLFNLVPANAHFPEISLDIFPILSRST